MSERVPADSSAEVGVRDLLAVVDRLGLEQFALYNHLVAGDAPVACAAGHPDRVTSVVWWVGQTIRSSPELSRQMDSISRLMESDWELYTNVMGRRARGRTARVPCPGRRPGRARRGVVTRSPVPFLPGAAGRHVVSRCQLATRQPIGERPPLDSDRCRGQSPARSLGGRPLRDGPVRRRASGEVDPIRPGDREVVGAAVVRDVHLDPKSALVWAMRRHGVLAQILTDIHPGSCPAVRVLAS
jgi:hypothetical protein